MSSVEVVVIDLLGMSWPKPGCSEAGEVWLLVRCGAVD